MPPHPLRVHRLALTDFRNHAALRVEPGAASVIITGQNGMGKTNILEAVSFLAPGRGLRRARLAEVDRIGGGAWAVAATADGVQGEVKLGTGRDPTLAEDSDKRLVKIDGRSARSHTELAQHLSIVWLTPEHDSLFVEGQGARRRFLDRLVFGFDAAHATRVNAYEQAVRERNRLLSMHRADPHWLDVLEQRISEGAVAITAARLETVAHLNAVMDNSPLSFPKAALALRGQAEAWLLEGLPAVQVEAALAEALRIARPEDAKSGRTSVGAHKSEWVVMHRLKGAEAARCSTGEQKAMLLAIVLAEARSGARWHGRVPVLLLDEVVSHLDEHKRTELFDELHDLGAQAWLTATEPAWLHGMHTHAHHVRVEGVGKDMYAQAE